MGYHEDTHKLKSQLNNYSEAIGFCFDCIDGMIVFEKNTGIHRCTRCNWHKKLTDI